MMVYCNKCGNPFEGNFCDKCGAPAKNSGVNTPVNPIPAQYSMPANTYPAGNVTAKKKFSKKVIIIIAAVLAVVVGGIFVKIQIDNAVAAKYLAEIEAEYEASQTALQAEAEAEAVKLRTEHEALLDEWTCIDDDDIGQISFSVIKNPIESYIEVTYDDIYGLHVARCTIDGNSIFFLDGKKEGDDSPVGMLSGNTFDYETNGNTLILGGATFIRK